MPDASGVLAKPASSSEKAMTEPEKKRIAGQGLRWATGLALGAVVLLLVLWVPAWITVVVFSLVAALGMWEYSRLALPQTPALENAAAMLAALAAPLASLAGAATVAAALGLGILLICLASFRSRDELAHINGRVLKRGFGLAYVGGLFACLMLIFLQPQGRLLFLFLVASVVAADAGAFYTGHLWGKHKLAPRISPGKSIEGLAGGMVLATLVGGAFGLLAFEQIGLWWGAGLGLAMAVSSAMGDLLESLIKRTAGAKDSGTILPGHGGLLDRVDGLVMAGPVLLLYLSLL